MTNDQIIRMAREAGFFAQELHCSPPIIRWSGDEKQLERFAALVAAHEREACIEKCKPYGLTGECVAIAIRAKGEK